MAACIWAEFLVAAAIWGDFLVASSLGGALWWQRARWPWRLWGRFGQQIPGGRGRAALPAPGACPGDVPRARAGEAGVRWPGLVPTRRFAAVELNPSPLPQGSARAREFAASRRFQPQVPPDSGAGGFPRPSPVGAVGAGVTGVKSSTWLGRLKPDAVWGGSPAVNRAGGAGASAAPAPA